jgi:hypothetical protein
LSFKKEYRGHPAISRKDNQTPICPTCGTIEALEGLMFPPSSKPKTPFIVKKQPIELFVLLSH